MRTLKLFLIVFLSIHSTAFALGSWEEDLQGDARKETKFFDNNNDGIPDTASVDKDGDGNYEEYWVDEDGDGNWDRMWYDNDGDGQFEKGFQDKDDDGDWDQKWEDTNNNDKVDPGERVEFGEAIDPDDPGRGPRPAIDFAMREECNCAGPKDEPEFVEAGLSFSSPYIVLAVVLIVLVISFIALRRRSSKN